MPQKHSPERFSTAHSLRVGLVHTGFQGDGHMHVSRKLGQKPQKEPGVIFFSHFCHAPLLGHCVSAFFFPISLRLGNCEEKEIFSLQFWRFKGMAPPAHCGEDVMVGVTVAEGCAEGEIT